MTILKLLEHSEIVCSYVVEEFRHWSAGSYFRIAARLVDGGVLHIREYASEAERMYSFHWQDQSGHLIRRWDNAPHHPNLNTFPHHSSIPPVPTPREYSSPPSALAADFSQKGLFKR